jgi:L-rhamnose mutarotase
MSELTLVLQRLEKIDENQRRDVENIYAEMKADREKADARRESDRAIFMQELENLFSNGCAYAERHNATAAMLEKQVIEMEKWRRIFDKGAGILWAIGAAASVIGLVSGWFGAFMKEFRGGH